MSTVPDQGAGRQRPLGVSASPAGPIPAASSASVIPHPSCPIADPIPKIIPAKGVSLLAGASGVGKTTLLAEWAVRFRDGKSIFGHATQPPSFIGCLVVDRRWSSHRQWFEAAGFPDIPHYSYQDDAELNWGRFHLKTDLIALLERGLDAIRAPHGALVIVDPIAMFVPGNLIDYKMSAIGLAMIGRLCEARGITLIGTAHMGKQKGDEKHRYKRPQDRILGSSALAGFTDTQMYLLGPDDTDEEYYGFGWIPHHAPAQTFELQRDPGSGLFVPYFSHDRDFELFGIMKTIPTERTGIPTKDIVEATETLRLSKATTYRYLAELKKLGYLAQPKAGRWFRVKEELPKTFNKLPGPTHA